MTRLRRTKAAARFIAKLQALGRRQPVRRHLGNPEEEAARRKRTSSHAHAAWLSEHAFPPKRREGR